jgi:hypothetical protein
MKLSIGMRLRSVVCATQVVVVRSPADVDVNLTCGGEAMIDLSAEPERLPTAAGHDAGTQLGKRYAHRDAGVELLCTRAGDGSLWLDGAPLELKPPKPLPASD